MSMERNCFIYKTRVSFIITSPDIDLDTISGELGIFPDRSFRKGDLVTSKHSPRVGREPYSLWAIQSQTYESEDGVISHHIEYLKSILLPKIDVLKRYKEDARFGVAFRIWIQTNDSAIGLDLAESEIAFMNSVSNSIHFSLLTMSRSEWLRS